MTEIPEKPPPTPVEQPVLPEVVTKPQSKSLLSEIEFKYEKPVENCFIKMDDETKGNLIKASLVEHLSNAQITLPHLEKYTKTQLNSTFQDMLKNPPNIKITNEIPYDVEFTSEEDVCLLNYIRNFKKTPLSDFIADHSHIFKLCRSLSEIEDRVKYLKSLKAEELDEIIQAEIDQIVYEQMYYVSLNPQTEEQKKHGIEPEMFTASRCNYQPLANPEVKNTEVDKQLEAINANLPFYVDNYFSPDSSIPNLAVLRTENNIFYMRRESIVFGRQSIDCDVDVDINFESEPSCPHTSRLQAILSFRPDMNFYLENIGIRAFRVNGELLKTGEICMLQETDILDFSGALFMFLPNKRLVNQIRANVKI
ncbi:hypothetical protein TVAG_183120 [Trichomonas vaginalis G3]|uniref:FHA domain-containing protein n=1 Tax=Trichomonas vaginalis (strain ATCC PRA-98 / G3) TaxID=412133 RepID=A2D950_TRIV3|nr:G-quadruplex RNA binding [Trichomonas vaginalis G3]EAY23076.1 hypothetical protein TVAG_183120 [Trichomonas vaginalis G3]KAI5519044.1 G-quadruplex RNA binding [Trichomonas vaginalis G3]|eukprot:XP_001584062.1 hypothetical protein [Trichomonas vaginalis G3]